MSTNLPGDVNIKKVIMTSIDGNKKSNILRQLTGISVFESILKATIYAEFQMEDGIDLLTDFPIIGEEKIEFEFVTPGGDKSTTYKLHVYGVENLVTDDQGGSRTYTLKCCSEEIFTDATHQVMKKYKDQTSNMVQQILKQELSTKKKINLESTKGIQEILVSSMTPINAINYIRKRSTSTKYKSSSFVFFENKDGYNFATIEFLFEQNKGKIGDKIFFYDSAVNANINNINFRNIIAYLHLGRSDTITKLKSGGVYNQTKSFDIHTGEYKEVEFSLPGAKFESPETKANDLNSGTFLQKYDKKKKFKQFIPVDSSLPDTFLPDHRGALQSFVQQVTQNLIWIHIYGDNVIAAGDVITCKLPKIVSTSGPAVKDRLIAGNYMVSKVRHIFQAGARWQYSQSLELISSSFSDKV